MKYNNCCFFTFLLLMLSLSAFAQVRVTPEQPILPVLTLKATNPVLKIQLERGSATDCSVKEITLSLQGTTNLKDIESLCLFEAGKNGCFSDAKPLGQPLSPAAKVLFKGNFPLMSDTTILWVSVKLKDKVNLNHRVQVVCKAVTTTVGKATVTPLPQPMGLRTGVAVRQSKQDGVNTSRIPGIVTSKKGTLLTVYDARYDSSRDLQGNMDIAMNRSFDGGESWQPMQVVLDRKEWGGLPEKYNGVSDACILVDDRSGDINVAGLWMYGVLNGKTGKWMEGMTQDSTRWIHQWHAKGSQPGLDVKETSQFLIAKSTDDGQTWPADKKILLDEYGSFGYSCITSVDESTIGIFYESSQANMVFQQVRLEELTLF